MLHLLVVGIHNGLTDLADVAGFGFEKSADILHSDADTTVPGAPKQGSVAANKAAKPLIGELKFFSY
jgi:hypothetical protein